MNDWNLTEHQLRSWEPRSPSAKLRQRLFAGAEAMVVESPSPFGGRWTWLVCHEFRGVTNFEAICLRETGVKA